MKERFFSELMQFQAGAERKAAWNKAFSDVTPIWHVLSFIIFCIAVAAADLLFYFLYALLEPLTQSGSALRPFLTVLPGLLGPLAGFAIVVLLERRNVRKNLRVRLNQLGRPICIKCGYNLTGNTSGVCPECAEPIKRTCPTCDCSFTQSINGTCPLCGNTL